MSNLREGAVRALYRWGWRYGAQIPQPLIGALSSAAAWITVQRNGSHLQNLRHNLTIASGQPATDRLLRAAVVSYLRNLAESFALAGWENDEIIGRVRTTGEDHLRAAFASQGAVVVLPHSGNWDLAGAWACLTGMPVTTVAEELPDEEFRAFLEFRESLGMEILSHRDPGALSALAAAVRQGRLVCLVADRDLLGTGLPVTWCGHQITMPAGPALVARRTGAALIPAVCQYDETGMVIHLGAPIQGIPGRDGLTAMTQHVADFFAEQIAQRPEDWHLMQPFFGDPR